MLTFPFERWKPIISQWRHNERDSVSNHRRLDCLPNLLFTRRSNKTSILRVSGLCEGNSPVTGEFLAQRPVTRKMFPFGDVIMIRLIFRNILHPRDPDVYFNIPVTSFRSTVRHGIMSDVEPDPDEVTEIFLNYARATFVNGINNVIPRSPLQVEYKGRYWNIIVIVVVVIVIVIVIVIIDSVIVIVIIIIIIIIIIMWYDGVVTSNPFRITGPFVWEIHRSVMDFPHKRPAIRIFHDLRRFNAHVTSLMICGLGNLWWTGVMIRIYIF